MAILQGTAPGNWIDAAVLQLGMAWCCVLAGAGMHRTPSQHLWHGRCIAGLRAGQLWQLPVVVQLSK